GGGGGGGGPPRRHAGHHHCTSGADPHARLRPMLPQLSLLGVAIRSHTSMLAIAVLFAVVVGPWWEERLEGIPRRSAFGIHVLLALAAIVGGHLHYRYNYPMVTTGRLPSEGLHPAGAMTVRIGGSVPVFALFRVHPVRMADALVPVSGIAICIARLGCFLNGCCFGVQCPYPWCLSFPPGSPPAVLEAEHKLVSYDSWSLPLHPLQLYFALTGLLITATALWLIPRKRYQGQVALVALVTFAASTYLLEPFREVIRMPYLGIDPNLQGITGWLLALAVLALLACEIGHRALGRHAPARVTS